MACAVVIAGLAAWPPPGVPAAATRAAVTPAAPQEGDALASLLECRSAVDQGARFAVFQGEMLAMPRTDHMAMRLDLRERADAAGAHAVQAPGLGVWRRSSPGVRDFKYVQRVINLDAPAAFTAVIQFRWFNARGRTIRHATRRTPPCAQPDERARLEIGDVTITAPRQDGSARYQVVVRNDGRGPVGPFEVALTINASSQTAIAPALAPGARAVLDTTGPRCVGGSPVEVRPDPLGQVPEALGGGQPRTVTCPLPELAGRGPAG